ncbi:LAGLIDADG family homing endonuclease, partial [candidate division KSB1 bacterium]
MVAYEAQKVHAYIIGVALGDGNLSNPNGRAIRLRVTCDTQYPYIQKEISENLQLLLPNNKVSIVPRKSTYCDISVYSNKLHDLLPWQVGHGSKIKQKPRVPNWVFHRKAFIISCLRGLLQTDGSIYVDRGYKMINFTNNIESLSQSVFQMMQELGYMPRIYNIKSPNRNLKYVVR